MSRPEDQIVFEDLHGVNEDEPVTIDLDASTKDDGITRTPADEVVDDGGKDDDDIRIDSLRSADDDDDIQVGDIVADETDGDDDAASKAGEDDDYSKKVKARIGRESRAKRKAQQEASYWKQQAEKLAKDSYERDKRSLERGIEQTDSAIERVQTDLERAIEDGQTKDQVRLTNELTDLKADKARAEFSLNDLSPDGNVQPFDGKISAEPDTAASEAAKWKDERSDWYGAAGFERQTRLANRIDREVYRDGYDVDTPEYFEELDRRIKEREPKLYDDLDANADKDDKHDKDGKRPTRSPVAPVGGADGRQRASRGSKVQLGEADFANMRRFGLDPKDPDVLKEYAMSKRESDSGANR